MGSELSDIEEFEVLCAGVISLDARVNWLGRRVKALEAFIEDAIGHKFTNEHRGEE